MSVIKKKKFTMKKWLTAFALLCCAQLLFAQPGRPGSPVKKNYPRLEVNVNYGFYPQMAATKFLEGHSEVTGDNYSYTSSDYKGNKVHTTGLIGVEVDVNLKRWLAVGLQFSGAPFWSNALQTGNPVKANVFSILPVVRFTYINADFFRMYSGLGLGVSLFNGFDNERSAYAGIGGTQFQVALQAVPVGFQFGRALYGFGEVSLGTINLGMRAGIGYRF